MFKMRWLSVLVLFGLLLNACSTAKIKDDCLVGRWMVTSDDVLGKAMLPPESFKLDELKFRGAAGAAGYQFNEDGTLTFLMLQWETHFDVLVDYILMPLVVSANGTATAKVKVNEDQIAVGEVTQDNTSFRTTLADEEMMTENGVSKFAPLFMPGAQTGRYKCEGDHMTITFTDKAGVAFELRFLRVKPATQ
jgi:hypothetical protein